MHDGVKWFIDFKRLTNNILDFDLLNYQGFFTARINKYAGKMVAVFEVIQPDFDGYTINNTLSNIDFNNTNITGIRCYKNIQHWKNAVVVFLD